MLAALHHLLVGLRALTIIALAAWAPLDCCCPGTPGAPGAPGNTGIPGIPAASTASNPPGCCPRCEPHSPENAGNSPSPFAPNPCPHGGPSIDVSSVPAGASLAANLCLLAPAPIGSLPPAIVAVSPTDLAGFTANQARTGPPPPDLSLVSLHCLLTV
ncbi:MAG: hypothetical protein NTW19_02655 [Planctomycetota bacterium]|nr:hypothetical protein [Planctomycetota bacterium]